MKLNFPKIIREFDLGEYAEEWKGQKIFVWVNPPSADLVALGDNFKKSNESKDEKEKESAEKAYFDTFSTLLSQGSDVETHCDVELLKELRQATKDTDPAFWNWFQTRVITEVNTHRLGQKKA